MPALLALQLRLASEVSSARRGLVGSSPERPGDDVGGSDTPLGELRGDAAELLNRPADQRAVRRALPAVFGGGVPFARRRIAAIMAKASITSET